MTIKEFIKLCELEGVAFAALVANISYSQALQILNNLQVKHALQLIETE